MPVDSWFPGCQRAAATDFEKHVYRPFAIIPIV
jgi:hypothetical protein